MNFRVCKVNSHLQAFFQFIDLVGIQTLQEPSENLAKPNGIDRFEIVGRKEFFHNDIELDAHLSRILEWWRGKRKPEGVPLEHASRCS